MNNEIIKYINEEEDLDEILAIFTQCFEYYIKTHCKKVTAEQLDIDGRKNGDWYITPFGDYIITTSQDTYYTGLEYVNPDCKTTIDQYNIYSNRDSRINDHLNYYYDNHNENVEEN